MVLLGKDFVDNQIIRIFKQPALDDLQAAAHRIEFVQVNAGDGIERVDVFNERACGHRDVRLSTHLVHDLLRHGVRKREPRALRRTDENVRAGASGTRRHVAQHAVTDSDQGQNQRDLDANGEYAEEGPHRPVL